MMKKILLIIVMKIGEFGLIGAIPYWLGRAMVYYNSCWITEIGENCVYRFFQYWFCGCLGLLFSFGLFVIAGFTIMAIHQLILINIEWAEKILGEK